MEVFAIGTFTLIFFVIIPAAGMAAVALIYLVIQAVTRRDNRDENKHNSYVSKRF